MEDWKTLLVAVDDDYLVGMANKGLVKRAYKDMEAGDYKVLSADGEAQVSVGAETATIRQPLGESTCSCPSRTICRHVLLGILALREYVGGGAGAEGEDAEEEKGTEKEKETKEEKGAKAEKAGGAEVSGENMEAAGEFVDEGTKKGGEITGGDAKSAKKEGEKPEKTEEGKDLKSHLLEEIAAYPLPALKKILGTKQIMDISKQMQVGQLPEITYSSVAFVKLPKGAYSVKLLSPLEYSTCTCHKKELCVHKAAALLWCKLTAGQVKAEELSAEEELLEYDFGQVREAAAQMKTFLAELLDTGLARTSPDVLDYLDRLALISHNAKLANFEGYWRALHDSYGNYLKRKASFNEGKLMEQFARLYQRVDLLGKSKDAAQISVLAGEFRAEYTLVGNLDLVGIVMEHFQSQTGYEGETVYFLEENTKEWYTYTLARPVFYETNRQRGKREKAAAPWELPVSLEELVGLRIHLSGARADARGRLSASAQTKGEVTGNCKKENRLYTGDLRDWYYRDFGKLFAKQVDTKRTPWRKEAKEERRDGELVFLRPYSFTKGEFSQTEQKLMMWLYDASGREVIVELAYSKREEWGIGYLEQLTEEKEPCFLGKLYFRDGRMRLYPVTVFEKGELVEDWEDKDGREACQKKDVTGEDFAGQMECAGTGEEENAGLMGGEVAFGKESTMDVLSQVLEEARSLLEELYQSGLDTVHDSTLEGFRGMEKCARQYGLAHLSGLFRQMADGAAMRRHRLKKEEDELAGVYAKTCEYLYLCREKVEIDRGWEYYGERGRQMVLQDSMKR